MNQQPIDARITYAVERFNQHKYDLAHGRMDQEDYNQKIEQLQDEMRETFGSLDQFNAALKQAEAKDEK